MKIFTFFLIFILKREKSQLNSLSIIQSENVSIYVFKKKDNYMFENILFELRHEIDYSWELIHLCPYGIPEMYFQLMAYDYSAMARNILLRNQLTCFILSKQKSAWLCRVQYILLEIW